MEGVGCFAVKMVIGRDLSNLTETEYVDQG